MSSPPKKASSPEQTSNEPLEASEVQHFSYELKIPKDRVAVLIGKEGKVKKEIEEATECKLNIDSQEGEVQLKGEDTLGLFTAREVIKAIGRGFNPEVALLLLKQDYALEMLSLGDYVGKSKHKMLRLKGRIIGEGGRARRTLEALTETHMVVYGKTIGILGPIEHIGNARRAVESLLAGSPHANVYKWLEAKRREAKIFVPEDVKVKMNKEKSVGESKDEDNQDETA
jgi:ribosomal RNA assembly protein